MLGWRTVLRQGSCCQIASGFLLVCGTSTNAQVGECRESAKLVAPGAALGDLLGVSVCVEGNTVVVGADGVDCAAGEDCGAAYVFGFDGASWGSQQKLIASDGSARDYFGSSVSLSHGVAVVGGDGIDCASGEDCGAAYVFRFDGSGYVQEQKLTASDGAANDWFGISVSIDRDRIAVGAWGDNCPAGEDNCGSVYVFHFDGSRWVQEQRLTASDGSAHDWFGISVSIDGDTIVVGAWGDDCAAGIDCGSVYIFGFDGSGWVQRQKLTSSSAESEGWFGVAVTVRGDRVVVGEVSDDCDAGIDCGSVSIFRLNGSLWALEQKLTASDAHSGDYFGQSVSLSGDTVLVGAGLTDCASGSDCGSAYVFRFDGSTWMERQKLSTSDGAPGDSLGRRVAISGNIAVAGALYDDCAAGTWCGSARVFTCTAPAIPALSELGLGAMGLLLLTAGALVFRSRTMAHQPISKLI